jgi:predicted metal-dependent phosphoesterase TrpH
LSYKFDLHVHTNFSKDCSTNLKDIILFAKKKGLNGVAITDHNTVEGALKLLKNKTDLIIIPGIEVSTKQGHILGINITTPVPPKENMEKTVKKIHDAGGIAIAAHPSAFFRGIGLTKRTLLLDAIEVINSSVIPFFYLTKLNKRFSNKFHLSKTAGSDSHLPETIGSSYTFIETKKTPKIENLIQSIKDGSTKIYGDPISWKLRLKKIFKKKKERSI